MNGDESDRMSYHSYMDETTPQEETEDRLLKPSEVAAIFRVNAKTVGRWARAGKITCVKTLGGHRRFLASDVERARKALYERMGES